MDIALRRRTFVALTLEYKQPFTAGGSGGGGMERTSAAAWCPIWCGQPGSAQRGPLSSSDPRTVDDFEVRPVGLGSEGVCLTVKRYLGASRSGDPSGHKLGLNLLLSSGQDPGRREEEGRSLKEEDGRRSSREDEELEHFYVDCYETSSLLKFELGLGHGYRKLKPDAVPTHFKHGAPTTPHRKRSPCEKEKIRGIKKKIVALARTKQHSVLLKWLKTIVRHLHWCARTSNGDNKLVMAQVDIPDPAHQ
ncbi:hypothetical protein HPB47_027436 [Ixodes persulcatus]|uniref:Uncharacterized protein n=1 Tax=Ixodes persulcatus TaxID=34615 RepID=A0AC60PWG6_IXOPE|nr:hypothetical protein HPB47_027436 [Ixodes persulcatus]